MESEIYITEQELAERWKTNFKTIARHRRNKDGKVPPALMLGGEGKPIIRYRLSDVEAFEKANTFGA